MKLPKKVLLKRAQIMYMYLEAQGVNCDLASIDTEDSDVLFYIRTARDLKGIIEHLYQKYDDVSRVSAFFDSTGNRHLVVGFEKL